MDISMFDETKTLSKDQLTLIEDVLQFAADYLHLAADTEMSVTFVNNQRIQTFNRDYRGKDLPTDVISFALEDEVAEEDPIIFTEAVDIPRNLGDIIISVEKADEQAKEYGHSFERELGFLAVHGFLHLNGYDHMEPADEAAMFELQKKVLEAYGLSR